MSEEQPIQLDTIVVQQKQIHQTIIDGELIGLDLETEQYYGLDIIGTDVYSMLKDPITVKDIIDKLMDKYDVDRETCATQVTSFLNQMLNVNLIAIHET